MGQDHVSTAHPPLGACSIAVPVTAGGRGWLPSAWQRIRLGLAEMNHASRRMVEVQAPWSVDSRWPRQ